MPSEGSIIQETDTILVTGAAGFLGPAVVERCIAHGYRDIRAFVRPSSNTRRLEVVVQKYRKDAHVEIVSGNLLSRDDCRDATRGAAVILHLVTSGDKSFAAAFLNSVITTRNLLDASLEGSELRRFVNVSSFAVYTNTKKAHGRILDESGAVEKDAQRRGDAYCYAKAKQDELVADYGRRFAIPYTTVRPGSVYGPGKTGITGRVGIDSFGPFLHLGGTNRIPFTYIDNCADAIVLAGIVPGVEGQTFNILDDDLPSSRKFLRLYKKNVRWFRSIYVPGAVSYTLCWLWEKYSQWSEGQLPPSFNRGRWHAEWKSTQYSNEKAKTLLGWTPHVSTTEGLRLYFEASRGVQHA